MFGATTNSIVKFHRFFFCAANTDASCCCYCYSIFIYFTYYIYYCTQFNSFWYCCIFIVNSIVPLLWGLEVCMLKLVVMLSPAVELRTMQARRRQSQWWRGCWRTRSSDWLTSKPLPRSGQCGAKHDSNLRVKLMLQNTKHQNTQRSKAQAFIQTPDTADENHLLRLSSLTSHTPVLHPLADGWNVCHVQVVSWRWRCCCRTTPLRRTAWRLQTRLPQPIRRLASHLEATALTSARWPSAQTTSPSSQPLVTLSKFGTGEIASVRASPVNVFFMSYWVVV